MAVSFTLIMEVISSQRAHSSDHQQDSLRVRTHLNECSFSLSVSQLALCVLQGLP